MPVLVYEISVFGVDKGVMESLDEISQGWFESMEFVTGIKAKDFFFLSRKSVLYKSTSF